MTQLESTWDPATRVLRTTLSGAVTAADVRVWEEGLSRALAALPGGTRFKLLYDLRGFAPADLDAHRAMREVVPRVLGEHGMRPAVLDLFDPPPAVAISTREGRACVAFANVHHDPVKMADYERRIGRPDQRFFTDVGEAEAWLRQPGQE